MTRAVATRLLGGLGAIFGASLVAFLFMRVLPGNPARLILGPLASQSAVTALVQQMGLHQPLYVQYYRFMENFFSGDWGFSYSAGAPVRTEILSRLPASLELGFYAFIFAFVSAVICALLATYRRGRVIDTVVRGVAFVSLGIPPFWFGLLLLIVFFEHLPIFPGPDGRLSNGVAAPPHVTGFYTVDSLLAGQWHTFGDAVWHLVLPAIALGFAAFGYLVRLLRANLLDVASEPYLVVVRSKGVGEWTTHERHALPNAFLPTLTASALLFAQLLAGSVLIETVFAWPGVGGYVVDAVLRQDYAVVQTFVLLAAFSYVAVNAFVDILYGFIDPRLRHPVATA